MAGTISVREGVRAGFGFIGPAARQVYGALLLFSIAAAGCYYVQGYPPSRGSLLLSLSLLTAANSIAFGALLRVGLSQTGLGPAGLQWRGLENRLFGLMLLSLAFFGVIVLVLTTIVAAIVVGLSVAADEPFRLASDWWDAVGVSGTIVFAGSVLGALAFLSWLGARLSLAPVITAARGRIQYLSTFALTKGVVWRVMALTLAWVAVAAICNQLGVAAQAASTPARAFTVLLAGLAYGFVVMPAYAGTLVYLYRRLAPEGEAA